MHFQAYSSQICLKSMNIFSACLILYNFPASQPASPNTYKDLGIFFLLFLSFSFLFSISLNFQPIVLIRTRFYSKERNSQISKRGFIIWASFLQQHQQIVILKYFHWKGKTTQSLVRIKAGNSSSNKYNPPTNTLKNLELQNPSFGVLELH